MRAMGKRWEAAPGASPLAILIGALVATLGLVTISSVVDGFRPTSAPPVASIDLPEGDAPEPAPRPGELAVPRVTRPARLVASPTVGPVIEPVLRPVSVGTALVRAGRAPAPVPPPAPAPAVEPAPIVPVVVAAPSSVAEPTRSLADSDDRDPPRNPPPQNPPPGPDPGSSKHHRASGNDASAAQHTPQNGSRGPAR